VHPIADVIVIGAGPAGSSSAILLRQRGYRVIVLEREVFPRFVVGESLLPAAWDLWEKLGVRERIERTDYPVKRGVLFRIEDTQETSEFLIRTDEFPEYFTRPYTYHVDRAHFDQSLVERAVEVGADVRQGWEVQDALFDGDRAVGVRAVDPEGRRHNLGARFVIDASGRRTLLATRLGRRYKNPDLLKVAYYTHFAGGGARRADDGSTVTDIHSTEGGWVWYIPLRDDTVSVGVVLDAAFVQAQKSGPQALFDRALEGDEVIRKWLDGARQKLELKKISSISYLADSFVGDGFVLVGDAAMFIDPIFSAGVMLAMRSADYAVEIIAKALETGDVSGAALAPYEERIRKPIQKMQSIILNWYRIMQQKNRNHIFRLSQTAPLLREQLVVLLSGGYDKADLDAFLEAQSGA
jgi:FAD-dependent halogenase